MNAKALIPINGRHFETNVPDMQAEQVEDDEAEYVPAKASGEKYAYFDSNTSVWVNKRKMRTCRA